MSSKHTTFYFEPFYKVNADDEGGYESAQLDTFSNLNIFKCIGDFQLSAHCDSITISKLHNITGFAIRETATFVNDIVREYYIKDGCYTVDGLCKELSKVCKNAIFTGTPSNVNAYEGTINIVESNFAKKIPKGLTYQIPNRIAYILGFVSYEEMFNNGIANSHEVILKKDGASKTVTRNVSLIKHLTFLQITTNFMLEQNKSIAYVHLTNDDIIKIFTDKLTIIPKVTSYNIISLKSIGT